MQARVTAYAGDFPCVHLLVYICVKAMIKRASLGVNNVVSANLACVHVNPILFSNCVKSLLPRQYPGGDSSIMERGKWTVTTDFY